jgi:hypothetical protein
VRRARLTVLLLGAAACNPLAFNDLADETWVDSTDKPDDVNSDGYAAALAFGGSAGNGAGIVAVATTPPYVVLLDYDGGGGVEKLHEEVRQGLSDAESLPVRPALATLPSEWGAEGPSAFLSVTSGAESYLMPFQAQTLEFAGSLVRLTDADSQAVAIATGDALDSGTGLDIVATTGDLVYLVANYTTEVNAVAARCTIEGALSLAIDFDGEILVGTPEGVRRLTAANIPEPPDPPNDAYPFPCTGGIVEAPEAIDGFGDTIATGDLDGDGFPDIAVAAPESGRVYVSFGITPSEWTQIDAPDGSDTFGYALAVGDLDHDGVGDLIVGDPGYDEEANDGGAVHVYRVPGDGSAELMTTLFDIDPESNQEFGQSVAVIDFDGDADKQILAVGAKDEVFTYFQVFPGSGQDVRGE